MAPVHASPPQVGDRSIKVRTAAGNKRIRLEPRLDERAAHRRRQRTDVPPCARAVGPSCTGSAFDRWADEYSASHPSTRTSPTTDVLGYSMRLHKRQPPGWQQTHTAG